MFKRMITYPVCWIAADAITMFVFSIFFFFQAEDGIRDGTVTGVQTCALPISLLNYCFAASSSPTMLALNVDDNDKATSDFFHAHNWDKVVQQYEMILDLTTPNLRSEERRVGKECKSQRAS